MSLISILSPLVTSEGLDSRIKPSPKKDASTTTKPSLWKTTEFKFYYIAFLVVVPLMFYAGLQASSPENPNYARYERLLSQGWLFGRKVDNSDSQYRFFRDNFALLSVLMLVHTSIKRIVLYSTNITKLRFDLIFGLIFLVAAHGVNSIRILAHMLILYAIAHVLKNFRRIATISIWIYGISTLFINDNFRAYPFGNICSFLSPLDHWYRGIIPRWDVFFNFTLLRVLSYNLDFLERWENLQKKKSPSYESKEAKSAILLNECARLTAAHPIQDYSLMNYIAYVTYTPLFIAGPIITFNDYVYQSKHTLPSINFKFIFYYAVRFVIALLSMEFILHFLHVVAISKTKAWENDTPFQISMIGLFNLNIIWLKLLIPWRLFRLWALLDGIDTPENMIRCVDNNYSSLAFWRAWHRSYNKWVVRYIYIPLGGSKNRVLTSLAVFSFVAIWHDIELKLLLWGWLIVLFLLPEIFATQIFSHYTDAVWYRHVCAVGAVFNIWVMMIANLFGFCLGSDGTKKLLSDMFCTVSGFKFVILASVSLFIAVQIMFEIREEEKRHGIYLKC